MFKQDKGSVPYIKFVFCENDICWYFNEENFAEINTVGSKDENTLVVSINKTNFCHINKERLFNFILTSMEGKNCFISFDIKNNTFKKRKRSERDNLNYIIFRDDKFTFNIGGHHKEIVANKHSIYTEILMQLEFFHKNIEETLKNIYEEDEGDSDTEIDE